MTDTASAPEASTTRLNRRETLLGGLLAAAAVGTFAKMPHTRIAALPTGQFGNVIPERAGAWTQVMDSGFVLPPEDEQRAAAVYEDQLTRTYSDGSSQIMLLMAYDRNQSGMLMIHRPESCYPGSGFTITATSAAPVALTPAIVASGRFLSTQRDTRIEQVLYWTRVGNRFPRDWHEQRYDIAMQNLHGDIPDGVLARMSVIEEDPDHALMTMRGFAAALFGACGRDGRAVLAGPVNA